MIYGRRYFTLISMEIIYQAGCMQYREVWRVASVIYKKIYIYIYLYLSRDCLPRISESDEIVITR